MEQTHGTWGTRTRIFNWDGGLVTFLELDPFQRCSYHHHKQAYNLFYVISGCLGVRTDKGYLSKLSKGQMFTVEPDIRHEFQTYEEPTLIVEVAFVKYSTHDIYRQTLGGPLEKKNE